MLLLTRGVYDPTAEVVGGALEECGGVWGRHLGVGGGGAPDEFDPLLLAAAAAAIRIDEDCA